MITLISQRIRETGNQNSDCLEHAYVKYFSKLGFNLIPVPNSKENLEFYLSLPVERIILTGGGDIGDEISKERDETEKALLDFAIKNHIPVLGICRGMQFINYYFGGKLIKISEISSQNHVAVLHNIEINYTALKGLIGENIQVNSYHNFGFDENLFSSELRVFAKAPDKTIEGIYHQTLPIAGIAWHPERESPNKEANEKIATAFLKGELFWKI
ncbi:MAG: gamma-glutamyl-gamma-aminobutyrate hydrolase family protein [Candidatus Pacearchaeota archaeon]|nr:gamma-glutamyl-gamma-aminobutyrate hydrolase family protein [Candidatus Pacearchaeota archaeon]